MSLRDDVLDDIFGGQTAEQPSVDVSPAEEKPTSFIDKAVDVGKGILSGPLKEAENIVQTGHDIANFVDDKLLGDRFINNDTDVDYVPDRLKPQSGAGKTAQALSAFATGWFSAGKWITAGVKGAKSMQVLAKAHPYAAQAVSTAVAGGALDFVAGDASDSRLADVLVDNDILRNSVVDYLASDEDDSAVEARFKNVLEGFVVGSALDAVGYAFKNIKKGIRASATEGTDASLKVMSDAGEAIRNANGEKVLVEPTMEYTPEAKAYWMKEEIRKDGKAVAEKLRQGSKYTPDGMINTRSYTESARDLIENLNPKVAEAVENLHMSMPEVTADAIDFCEKAGGSSFWGEGNFKYFMENIKDAPDQKKVGALSMYLGVYSGTHADIVKEQLKEGLPNAMENARGLVTRTLEAAVELKKLTMKAGQTGKAADVLRYTGKAGTKGIQTLDNAIPDALAYAKEAIGKLGDDELVEVLNTLRITSKNNGTDMLKVLTATLDKQDILRQAAKNGTSPIFDAVFKYRFIAMLSGIKTHMRNAIGNSTKTGVLAGEEIIQNMIRGGMEGFQSGGVSGMAVGALRGAKEGMDYSRGLMFAWKDSWDKMKLAYDYGQAFSRQSEVSEIAARTLSQGGSAQKIYEAPLRALAAVDELFASINGTAKAYQGAMRDLRKSGLLEGVTDKAVKSDLTERWLDDYMTKAFTPAVLPDGRIIQKGHLAFKDSKLIANEATYQQALEGFGKSMNDFVQKHPATRLIFPFVKTPTNLFKDIFWTRGIHAPVEFMQAIKSKDPAQIAKAATWMSSAIFLWVGSYELVAGGRITGNGPKNATNRQALIDNGWQPNSFKTENGWVKLASIEPFGSALEFLANCQEMAQRGEVTPDSLDYLDVVWSGLLNYVTDRTYLKGLADLMETKQSGLSGAPTQMLVSFIPNIFNDIGKSMDEKMYDTKSALEKLQAKAGITEQLAPKVSWMTGYPRLYESGGGLGAFSPVNMTEDKGSIVFNEMSRVSGVGDPPRKIGSVELAPVEYAEYCRLHGTVKIDGMTLYETLEKLFQTDWYKSQVGGTEFKLAETQDTAIYKIVQAYRRTAQREFIKARPYLANGGATGSVSQDSSPFDSLINS